MELTKTQTFLDSKNKNENENESKNNDDNKNEMKTKIKTKVNSTWPRGTTDGQLSLTWPPRSAITFSFAIFTRGLAMP